VANCRSITLGLFQSKHGRRALCLVHNFCDAKTCSSFILVRDEGVKQPYCPYVGFSETLLTTRSHPAAHRRDVAANSVWLNTAHPRCSSQAHVCVEGIRSQHLAEETGHHGHEQLEALEQHSYWLSLKTATRT